MADKKISQLTGATTPLAGTEVLPIVQGGSTVKVASDDLTVKNVRSNATTGILQVAGPGVGATRTMTVPDANFTTARTDAAQNFAGNNTFDTDVLAIDASNNRVGVGTALPLKKLNVVIDAVSGRQTMTAIDRTAQNLLTITNPEYSTDASMGMMFRVFPQSDARQGAGIIASGGSGNNVTNLDLFASGAGGADVSYSAINVEGVSGDVKVTTGNLVIGTAGKGIADSSNVDRVSIASGSTVVNESGADIDFRVESDTDANCLFVDASTNRVGIGTSTPDYKFHVTSGSTSTTAKVLSTSTTAYSPTTGAVVTNARMELWGGNATDSYTAIRFTHSGSFENYFGAVQNAAGTGEFVWGGYTGASYGEFARLTPAGILSIGGSAVRATTPGTAQLQIFNGNSPVGTLANGISIYSSSGEAYVMDAAGNATLFSPHDSETNEWIFKSKHTPSGKVLRIDVEKMLRFINEHFGLDAIQEFTEK